MVYGYVFSAIYQSLKTGFEKYDWDAWNVYLFIPVRVR